MGRPDGFAAVREFVGIRFICYGIRMPDRMINQKLMFNVMKYIYSLALLLSSIQIWAAPVTPEVALTRLNSRHLSLIRGLGQTPRCSISEILTDSCGNNTVYLFDSEDGFVVCPADDALPAVLGYGDGQMYDAAGNMPTGFREWLQYMGQRVSEAGASGNEVTGAASVGEAIGPLCTTAWGQGDPFNLECPEYTGEKCLSGCVATAMAQIMKYHNWPPQGKGELEYRAEIIKTDIYTDFSRYTFDWGNMLDDYSSASASEQQRMAVARLLRGVGGSVRMNYSLEASGSDLNNAADALLDNWDYNDDMRYLCRSWFTLRDWSQLLYDALKNYGPILYGGFSMSSAHAFVCDGYDGNGLFHFNWGWDGKANGYFAIDFLNPKTEDQPWLTGYNGGQSALLNIHPRSPENPGTRTYAVLIDSYYVNPATGFSDGGAHTLHPGESFKMNGGFDNYGPFPIPAGSEFATIFTALYDGTPVPTNIASLPSEIETYGSFDRNMKTVPSGLPDGLYSLANDLYISPSGWGHSIHPPFTTRYCALVENNGSDIRFIESIRPPETVDSDIPDQIDIDSSVEFRAALRSYKSSDLERPVRAELIQDGVVKGWSSWTNASFGPEETIDFVLTADNWAWKEESVSHAGDYLLCLSMRNSYGDIWIPMGKGKKVTVSDSAAIDAVRVDSCSPDGIYDLHGRKVSDDVRTLSEGIYIIWQKGEARKISLPVR